MVEHSNLIPFRPDPSTNDRLAFEAYSKDLITMVEELAEFARWAITPSIELEADDAFTADAVRAWDALRTTRKTIKALADLSRLWFEYIHIGLHGLEIHGEFDYSDAAFERDLGKRVYEEFLPKFTEAMRECRNTNTPTDAV